MFDMILTIDSVLPHSAGESHRFVAPSYDCNSMQHVGTPQPSTRLDEHTVGARPGEQHVSTERHRETQRDKYSNLPNPSTETNSRLHMERPRQLAPAVLMHEPPYRPQ